MTSPQEVPQKSINNMSSEELGLALARLFEQGFRIQQDIHAVTAELTRRQQQLDEATKGATDATDGKGN